MKISQEKKRRLIAWLLAIVVLVGLVPVAPQDTYAAETVTSFNFTIDADAWTEFCVGSTEGAAQAQLENEKPVGIAPEDQDKYMLDWTNVMLCYRSGDTILGTTENQEITEDRQYVLKFFVEAKPGYQFNTRPFFLSGTKVTVNGVEVEPVDATYNYYFNCWAIYVDITELKQTGIKDIVNPSVADLKAPVRGQVSQTVVESKDPRYSVVSVEWFRENDDSFKAGDVFTDGIYTSRLVLKPSEGYRFKNTNGVFDGEVSAGGMVSVAEFDGDNLVLTTRYFPIPKANIVEQINLTLDTTDWSYFQIGLSEISAHEQLVEMGAMGMDAADEDKYEIDLSKSGLCYIKDSQIVQVTDNSALVKENREYLIKVYVDAKEDYNFSSNSADVTIMLNGSEVTPVEMTYDNTYGAWALYFSAGEPKPEVIVNGIHRLSDGKLYYVVNNVVDNTFTGLYEQDGVTYYVIEGCVDSDYIGIRKNGSDFWYVNQGQAMTDFDGLVNYIGYWWYVKEGKIDVTYTGMVDYSGYTWYVAAGKVDTSFTGLGQHNGVWYCVQAGKVNLTYTGLVQNAGIWWYVTNGVLDLNTTGIIETGGDSWLVCTGKLQSQYSGTYAYNGETYTIVNGKVTAVN